RAGAWRPHPRRRLRWRPAGTVRHADARHHGRDRRGSAAAHRGGHRRPRVPRPRRARTGGDLRRDRPARAGRAPRTAAAATGRALSMAARRGAGARVVRHVAATAPLARGSRSVGGGRVTGLLAQLQFVRPHWLWALAALPLLAAWWYRQQRRASIWH